MRNLIIIIALNMLMLTINGCAFVNVPLIAQTKPLEEQVLEGNGNRFI